MKQKYEFVVQEVGDAFVAVAVGDDAAKFSGLIRMNQTGKEMFELLRNEMSESELVAAMMERYEGTEQEIRESVRQFVDALSREGILE